MRWRFAAFILAMILVNLVIAQVTNYRNPLNGFIITWFVTASVEIRNFAREIALAIAVLSIIATTGGLFLTSRGRQFRHDAWTKRGDTATINREWNRASQCYRRAIRAQPHIASTWYGLIQAELMARNGHTAEQLACQAARIPGMDPWDLLALRAAAAWLRCDNDALYRHLHRLREGAPDMAQFLAQCLQVELPQPPEKRIDRYS